MFVWTLSDLFGVLMWAVLLLVMAVYGLATLIRRWRCPHEDHDYYETRACDAICQGCGKNLGFIANVRKQRQGK